MIGEVKATHQGPGSPPTDYTIRFPITGVATAAWNGSPLTSTVNFYDCHSSENRIANIRSRTSSFRRQPFGGRAARNLGKCGAVPPQMPRPSREGLGITWSSGKDW